MKKTDLDFLMLANDLTSSFEEDQFFPCGAVVIKDDEVVATGLSKFKDTLDPTAHAEISAIRSAVSSLNAPQIIGGVLYSTLEPCLMCLHAAYWAGIRKIVYGASKEKIDACYYEGNFPCIDAKSALNEDVELVYLPAIEIDIIAKVKRWEFAVAKK